MQWFAATGQFISLVVRSLLYHMLLTENISSVVLVSQMYAELQLLSPLVPTREIYFLRFCKQHGEGVWAVVDVSVDSLRDNPPPSLMRCRRRPSGYLVQEMPNGGSKVWVGVPH